jgi:hypothetical protein
MTAPTNIEIDRRVTTLRERNLDLTKEAACAQVLRDDPTLYTDLQAEKATPDPTTDEWDQRDQQVARIFHEFFSLLVRQEDPALSPEQVYSVALGKLPAELKEAFVNGSDQ